MQNGARRLPGRLGRFLRGKNTHREGQGGDGRYGDVGGFQRGGNTDPVDADGQYSCRLNSLQVGRLRERMSILSRYLLKQHAAPFGFAIAALTSIMLLNEVAKRIGELLGKGLPWHVIVEVFALSVPFIVALTLPMAVLVAVLYAVSRLAGDNEITAMRAGGISLWRILRTLLIAGAVVTVIAFLFNDHVLPQTNHKLRTLYSDIARKKPTFSIKEQVVNEIQPNRLFLRTTHIDPATYQLRDVSIYDLSDQDRQRVIYADSGSIALTTNQEDARLTLFDGEIHDFDRADPRMFQQIGFRIDVVRIAGVGNELKRTLHDTYRSDREMGVCAMETIVRSSTQQEVAAQRSLDNVQLNTMRSLVGLAPLPEPAAPPAPGPSLYCRAMRTLASAVLPPPLAAQEPQQGQDTTRGAAARAKFQAFLRERKANAARRSATETQPTPGRDNVPAPTERRFTVSGQAMTRGVPAVWRGEAVALQGRITSARRTAADYLVEIHKKYAIAVACLVFVIVGVPTAVRFRRGGIGLVIGVSLAIFGIYYVGLIAGESLANRLIVPPTIMWAPNIIFAIVGLILLARTRSEGVPPVWQRRRARRDHGRGAR